MLFRTTHQRFDTILINASKTSHSKKRSKSNWYIVVILTADRNNTCISVKENTGVHILIHLSLFEQRSK